MSSDNSKYYPARYSHDIFDGLERLEDTFQKLTERNVQREVLNNLRTIFHNHNVADKLGLMLLHRHFDMQPHEMLVEYGRVSTPWEIPAIPDAVVPLDDEYLSTHYPNVLGGKLIPRCWKFHEGHLYPTEFGFNPPALLQQPGSDPLKLNPAVPLYHEMEFETGFVEALASFMKEQKLDDIFGLTLVDTAAELGRFQGVERTVGRVSLTIPASQAASATPSLPESATPELSRSSSPLSHEGVLESTAPNQITLPVTTAVAKQDSIQDKAILKAVLQTGLEAVWTFGCHEDLSNSEVFPRIARVCWVCEGCKKS